MCRLQTYTKCKQVYSKHAFNSRRSVERMLRDFAFVLEMTCRVKHAILTGNDAGSAEHTSRKAHAERRQSGSAWQIKLRRSGESMN